MPTAYFAIMKARGDAEKYCSAVSPTNIPVQMKLEISKKSAAMPKRLYRL